MADEADTGTVADAGAGVGGTGSAPAAVPPPAKTETLMEAMARHEAALGGAEADGMEGATEEGAPADPEPTPAAKPKKVYATPPEEAERAQFQALAKKLGFEVDDRKVSTKERAEYRESKKKQKDALERAEREAMAAIAKGRQELETERSQVDAIRKAHAASDYDGLAKALGHKDWEDLQNGVIAQLTDPNYKKMRELERWKEDQEAKAKQLEEQHAVRAQEEQREQAIRQYIVNLAETMKTGEDKFLSTMADDPWFVSAIHAIQKQEFDGSSTVTPAEALDIRPPGSPMTLRKQLETVRDRLNKAFGPPPAAESPAPAPKPAAAKPAPKPASRTDVLPNGGKREPSGAGKSHQDGPEYWKQFRDRLRVGIDEDRKAGNQ